LGSIITGSLGSFGSAGVLGSLQPEIKKRARQQRMNMLPRPLPTKKHAARVALQRCTILHDFKRKKQAHKEEEYVFKGMYLLREK